MTETDRLRAALRLCAVVVRHVEEDGCPHGSERCMPGEHPCADCRAAIYAATLALRAVAPDAAPRDAVLDWAIDDPDVRARALAIVRDAGLADRPERCPTCGLADPHTHVPMVSDGRGTWTRTGEDVDPHEAAPGDVLQVASVEDLPGPDEDGWTRGGPDPIADIQAGIAALDAIRAQHPDEARVAVAREFAGLLRPLLGEAVVFGYEVHAAGKRWAPDADAVTMARHCSNDGTRGARLLSYLAKWEVT